MDYLTPTSFGLITTLLACVVGIYFAGVPNQQTLRLVHTLLTIAVAILTLVSYVIERTLK